MCIGMLFMYGAIYMCMLYILCQRQCRFVHNSFMISLSVFAITHIITRILSMPYIKIRSQWLQLQSMLMHVHMFSEIFCIYTCYSVAQAEYLLSFTSCSKNQCCIYHYFNIYIHNLNYGGNLS